MPWRDPNPLSYLKEVFCDDRQYLSARNFTLRWTNSFLFQFWPVMPENWSPMTFAFCYFINRASRLKGMKLILLMWTHLRVLTQIWYFNKIFNRAVVEHQSSTPRSPRFKSLSAYYFFKVRDKCCYLTAVLQFGSQTPTVLVMQTTLFSNRTTARQKLLVFVSRNGLIAQATAVVTILKYR